MKWKKKTFVLPYDCGENKNCRQKNRKRSKLKENRWKYHWIEKTSEFEKKRNFDTLSCQLIIILVSTISLEKWQRHIDRTFSEYPGNKLIEMIGRDTSIFFRFFFLSLFFHSRICLSFFTDHRWSVTVFFQNWKTSFFVKRKNWKYTNKSFNAL